VGTLERPVNARMYRGTWLLLGLPLLVAAFSVARAQPLPPATVPPTFDADAALALAGDLTRRAADRSPGSPPALGAQRWLTERFGVYGFRVQRDEFTAEIPGRGRVPLANLYAVATGPAAESPVIVVMAHRDDSGLGRGANDNASGTAALIELARPYARAPGGPGSAVSPAHTIVFLSTDGGAFGGIGAERFAERSPYRNRIVAVVNLDTIAGPGRPRLELAGDAPLSPPPALVQTAADSVLDETGNEPVHAHALAQLVDLGFPFSLYEQAPLVARGIPAITLTTASERPPSSFRDSPQTLSQERIGEVGRAAQSLLVALDQGLELPATSSPYVYLGPRIVPGWAIQIVLLAALLPFLAATVDLFARCRRRRIPLAPALRAYRSRLLFWLFVGLLFGLLGVLGAWPEGAARPLSPESDVVQRWPLGALVVLVGLSLLAWLVPRERLLPRRRVEAAEELAGYTAALLALGLLALVVFAANAFTLVFLLPSLHAWLWLPQLRDRPPWTRAAVLAAGFAGPLLLVASVGVRLGLGVDTPWYLAALVAVGYVEPLWVVVVLAWAAAVAQLAVLTAHRYAPYPSAAERPPRGPIREVVRRTVLALRARGEPAEEVEALEG
jgi:hypothetical protein